MPFIAAAARLCLCPCPLDLFYLFGCVCVCVCFLLALHCNFVWLAGCLVKRLRHWTPNVPRAEASCSGVPFQKLGPELADMCPRAPSPAVLNVSLRMSSFLAMDERASATVFVSYSKTAKNGPIKETYPDGTRCLTPKKDMNTP